MHTILVRVHVHSTDSPPYYGIIFTPPGRLNEWVFRCAGCGSHARFIFTIKWLAAVYVDLTVSCVFCVSTTHTHTHTNTTPPRFTFSIARASIPDLHLTRLPFQLLVFWCHIIIYAFIERIRIMIIIYCALQANHCVCMSVFVFVRCNSHLYLTIVLIQN